VAKDRDLGGGLLSRQVILSACFGGLGTLAAILFLGDPSERGLGLAKTFGNLMLVPYFVGIVTLLALLLQGPILNEKRRPVGIGLAYYCILILLMPMLPGGGTAFRALPGSSSSWANVPLAMGTGLVGALFTGLIFAVLGLPLVYAAIAFSRALNRQVCIDGGLAAGESCGSVHDPDRHDSPRGGLLSRTELTRTLIMFNCFAVLGTLGLLMIFVALAVMYHFPVARQMSALGLPFILTTSLLALWYRSGIMNPERSPMELAFRYYGALSVCSVGTFSAALMWHSSGTEAISPEMVAGALFIYSVAMVITACLFACFGLPLVYIAITSTRTIVRKLGLSS
jgi:hypothetical protein